MSQQKTLQEVGNALGMTKQGARHLIEKGRQLKSVSDAKPDSYLKLSVRAQNILQNHFKDTPEFQQTGDITARTVALALSEGEFLKMTNSGPVTAREVGLWLRANGEDWA